MRLIFSISFIIISIILFFTLIDPLYKEVRQLKSDVSTYNTALSNSTELQKARDSLLDKFKNITEDDKRRLEHMIPSTINNIDLILEIEKIANLNGMPIGDIKFDPNSLQTKETVATTSDVVVTENEPQDYLPYGIFPMEFSVEGKYETFVKFLKDLERNLRLVDVRSITFEVPGAGVYQTAAVGDLDVYDYILRIDTYWLK